MLIGLFLLFVSYRIIQAMEDTGLYSQREPWLRGQARLLYYQGLCSIYKKRELHVHCKFPMLWFDLLFHVVSLSYQKQIDCSGSLYAVYYWCEVLFGLVMISSALFSRLVLMRDVTRKFWTMVMVHTDVRNAIRLLTSSSSGFSFRYK